MKVGVVKLSSNGSFKLSIKAPKNPVKIEISTYQIPPIVIVDPNRLNTGAEKKIKVKITIAFRGREMSHRELGREITERIEKDLAEVAKVENQVKFLGKSAFMMIAPI